VGVHIGKQIVKGLVQNKDTEKPLKASNTIFLLISYEGALLANQIRNFVDISIAITLLGKSKFYVNYDSLRCLCQKVSSDKDRRYDSDPQATVWFVCR